MITTELNTKSARIDLCLILTIKPKVDFPQSQQAPDIRHLFRLGALKFAKISVFFIFL